MVGHKSFAEPPSSKSAAGRRYRNGRASAAVYGRGLVARRNRFWAGTGTENVKAAPARNNEGRWPRRKRRAPRGPWNICCGRNGVGAGAADWRRADAAIHGGTLELESGI